MWLGLTGNEAEPLSSRTKSTRTSLGLASVRRICNGTRVKAPASGSPHWKEIDARGQRISVHVSTRQLDGRPSRIGRHLDSRLRSHRRVVDRYDGECNMAGGGASMAVAHGVGKGVGTIEVGVRTVGKRA